MNPTIGFSKDNLGEGESGFLTVYDPANANTTQNVDVTDWCDPAHSRSIPVPIGGTGLGSVVWERDPDLNCGGCTFSYTNATPVTVTFT